MKKILPGSLLTVILAAGTACAAGLPNHSNLRGEYVEARTADVYTGPCFANGEMGLVGDLAVFGWRIDQGEFQGVPLNGLSVVAAVKASGTLGDPNVSAYPAKAVLIVDEKASPEQRLALRAFAQRMGGDLLQDIIRLDYQPIQFDLKDNNVHAAQATLKAGNMLALVTRAMHNGDHICGNEEVFYPPLTKVDHAMPAATIAHSFRGQGLGTTWSSPDKRSAFVASFHLND